MRLRHGRETGLGDPFPSGMRVPSGMLDTASPAGRVGRHHRTSLGHGVQDADSARRTKAVFIDTDQVPGLDSRVGDLVQNETEARLVQQLATSLTDQGVEQGDIAVITPYRQQIKLLASRIGPSMPSIEILTADKSQGRDKDCIIISLVRSNENGFVSLSSAPLDRPSARPGYAGPNRIIDGRLADDTSYRLVISCATGGGSTSRSPEQRRNWSLSDRRVPSLATNC